MSRARPTTPLQKIRPKAIRRVLDEFARGVDVRTSFEGQLIRFFDLLEQALASGDPAWLDSILYDWVNAATQTDRVEGHKNASLLINTLFIATSQIARDTLTKGEALDWLTTTQPYFAYALEKAARLELETRVTYFANEMASVQQKLERLERSKSNFISVAAHELKTPLTLIEGYTAMLSDAISAAGTNTYIQTLLQGVRTGIERLRQIIDDMIDVSLIDNHMLSLNLQPLWIGYLLELLRKNLWDTLQSRHQTLEIRDFPGSRLRFYGDPERLYQAFYNVLTNAIKYTPDGGSITIDGRLLPGFVEVTITDTGIGISPEDQEVIFEKFGRLGRAELHSSSKVKFKGGGPGLGLSISRGIIEAHGGTIWVESEGYDEIRCPGSTFHILLPIRTKAADSRLAQLFGEPDPMNQETDVQKETRTDSPPS